MNRSRGSWQTLMAIPLVALVTSGCANEGPVAPDAPSDPDAALPVADANPDSLDASVVSSDDTGSADAGAPADVFTPVDVAAEDAPGAAPDAGPEPCASEGMFRRVACACGGMQSEQCTSGVWHVVVACDGVMECTPGAFETRMGSWCTVDQRTCADDCAWGDWTNVVPRGACPGPGVRICTVTTNCECQSDCTCRPYPECPTMP